MKLGDMSFEDSRNAELLIAPIVEKIMSDAETTKLFDGLLGGGESKQYVDMNADEKREFVKKRVQSSKELTKRLIHAHFEDTCGIFAALHKVSAKDIKEWKRSEANEQIAEMFDDSDLVSFFMSSEALVQAVQFAISQE